MTFAELKATAIKWYGKIDWKVGLLHHLDIDPVTLWRWQRANQLPAPYPLLIEAWDQLGGPPDALPLEKSLRERKKRERRRSRARRPGALKSARIITDLSRRKSTKDVLGI